MELLNWWVVLGVGQAGRPLKRWAPSWLLTQNLATWEENGSFFPSLHYFFGFCSFFFIIFETTIFPHPGVQVTV